MFISSRLSLQCGHLASLKAAMMGLLSPKKLANAENLGVLFFFFFPETYRRLVSSRKEKVLPAPRPGLLHEDTAASSSWGTELAPS